MMPRQCRDKPAQLCVYTACFFGGLCHLRTPDPGATEYASWFPIPPHGVLGTLPAAAPFARWPRELSEAEMDALATALNEHDAGSIGFHALVDRVLAVAQGTDGVMGTDHQTFPHHSPIDSPNKSGVK